MDTKQTEVTSLKAGRYVVLEGIACVVKSIQTSRPGKHGHAKCRIEAVGIKDGRKIILVLPGHDKVDAPIIGKRGAQVLSINGNVASVMDLESYETFNLDIPDELKGQVAEGSQVVYWIVLGEKMLKQVK